MLAGDLPVWFVRGVAFLFGALWGSFFNVAIYRWPREMSVVAPPSHCPSCGAPVPWYRNVPILAYLLQRGRAACCGAPMTPRYLLVEALSGVLCLAVAERYFVHAPALTEAGDAAAQTVLYFAFVGALLVATFTDLEWMIIPDEVTLPGAALGLVSVGWRDVDAAEMAIGAGAGFLLVQLVFVWSYERLTGRRGMGEGDAKLLLLIGAFVGWRGVLFAVAAGSIQGVLAAAVAFLTRRPLAPSLHPIQVSAPANALGEGPPPARCDELDGPVTELEPSAEETLDAAPAEEAEPDGAALEGRGEGAEDDEDAGNGPPKVPFGPFLALGALEWLFFGDAIVEWYLDLLP